MDYFPIEIMWKEGRAWRNKHEMCRARQRILTSLLHLHGGTRQTWLGPVVEQELWSSYL